ncbi:MAG: methyltransferase domain-containing protein [Anaerolineales bacterium]
MKIIHPQSSSYWKKNYVTYRRLWLDTCLNAFADEMRGIVLDLGGKRENKRGSFQPPEQEAQAWWYLNLDLSTRPNIFADVTCVPMLSNSVNCILCTEVLEHIQNPQTCVDEIHRILLDDGIVFVSTPFFYPVHADPHDFQRFTEDGLRYLFREFKTVEVYRMGGYAGVLGLLVELGVMELNEKKNIHKLLRWCMKWISRWLIYADISKIGSDADSFQKFTTGYFLKAIR